MRASMYSNVSRVWVSHFARNGWPLFTACAVHRLLVVFLLVGAASTLAPESNAQEVRVDATPSHMTNSFNPLYALGTTVDRVPSNATDTFFRPDQLKQVLSAGWGAVSYRQNTELFVQAWHWNPRGTWSDPSDLFFFCYNASRDAHFFHTRPLPL